MPHRNRTTTKSKKSKQRNGKCIFFLCRVECRDHQLRFFWFLPLFLFHFLVFLSGKKKVEHVQATQILVHSCTPMRHCNTGLVIIIGLNCELSPLLSMPISLDQECAKQQSTRAKQNKNTANRIGNFQSDAQLLPDRQSQRMHPYSYPSTHLSMQPLCSGKLCLCALLLNAFVLMVVVFILRRRDTRILQSIVEMAAATNNTSSCINQCRRHRRCWPAIWICIDCVQLVVVHYCWLHHMLHVTHSYSQRSRLSFNVAAAVGLGFSFREQLAFG